MPFLSVSSMYYVLSNMLPYIILLTKYANPAQIPKKSRPSTALSILLAVGARGGGRMRSDERPKQEQIHITKYIKSSMHEIG